MSVEKYKPCIYQIRNLINNKVYIGSTFRFNRRKRLHSYLLKKGLHKNIHLQRAWNKYGKVSFIFEILENIDLGNNFDKNLAKIILCEKEQKYIDALPKSVNNYNIRKLAHSNLGTKLGPMNEDQKRKIGLSNRKFTNEQILEMFNLSKLGYTNKHISEVFFIDASQVSRILNGRYMYKEFVNKVKPINSNIKPNKLGKDKILEIFKKLRNGASSKDIEIQYSINQSTVSRIKNQKRNYSWLQDVK